MYKQNLYQDPSYWRWFASGSGRLVLLLATSMFYIICTWFNSESYRNSELEYTLRLKLQLDEDGNIRKSTAIWMVSCFTACTIMPFSGLSSIFIDKYQSWAGSKVQYNQRNDHSRVPLGILITTFVYGIIYFSCHDSLILVPLFYIWYYIQSSVFHYSVLTVLHRAFRQTFTGGTISSLLCLHYMANIAHFALNMDFGANSCGMERAIRAIPFALHMCYYVCFILVLFPTAWSTQSMAKHGVQSDVAAVKVTYGYLFLALMMYQSVSEYSLSPMSGITRSHWCHASPLYVGCHLISLLIFITLYKIITKLCGDLYVQGLLRVRYARYNYGKHLAHLISIPMEALTALLNTLNKSAAQSALVSRIASPNGTARNLKCSSSSSEANPDEGNIFSAVGNDNLTDMNNGSVSPRPMVSAPSMYTHMKAPDVRPKLPQVLGNGLAEMTRLLKLLQHSSNNVIDINGPAEIIPFIESVYVDYIDRCEQANVQLMVPSDESVDALAGKCIAVDLDKMRLALTDILDNSLKYTISGSVLAVAAEVVTTDDIPRTASTHGSVPTLADYRHEFVEIRIQDSGIKLRPEELEHVFDHKEVEQSLSCMYIIKTLVELHEGAVFVQSPGDGHGVEINIYLPIISINLNRRKPSQSFDAGKKMATRSYIRESFNASASKIIPADISSTSKTIADTLYTTAKSARELLAMGGGGGKNRAPEEDMSAQTKFKYIPDLNKPCSLPHSYGSSYGNEDELTEEAFDQHRYAMMRMGDGHGGTSGGMKPSPVIAFDLEADYGFDVSSISNIPGSGHGTSRVESTLQRDAMANSSLYMGGAPNSSARSRGGAARYGGIDPIGLMASLAMAAGVSSTPLQQGSYGREPTAREINNSLRALADANLPSSSRRGGSRIDAGGYGHTTSYGGIDPMGLMAKLNSLVHPTNRGSLRIAASAGDTPIEDGPIFRQNSRAGHVSHRSVRRADSSDFENDFGTGLSSAGLMRQSSGRIATGPGALSARKGSVASQNSSDRNSSPLFEITPAGTNSANPGALRYGSDRSELTGGTITNNSAVPGIMRQYSGGIGGAHFNSNQPSITRQHSGESGRFVMCSRASSGGIGSEKSGMTGGVGVTRAEDISPAGTGVALAGDMRRHSSRSGQMDISPAGTGRSNTGSMRRAGEMDGSSGMEMRRNSRTGQMDISPAGTGRSNTGSMRRTNGVGYSNNALFQRQDSGAGSEKSYLSNLTAGSYITAGSVPAGEIANIESLRSGPASGYTSGRSVHTGPGPTPYNFTPGNRSRASSAQSVNRYGGIPVGANTPNSFSPPGTFQGGVGMMRAT